MERCEIWIVQTYVFYVSLLVVGLYWYFFKLDRQRKRNWHITEMFQNCPNSEQPEQVHIYDFDVFWGC